MRKRVACTLVAVALVLLLLPGQAFGQQFGDTVTESRLFNVEMGFLTGYRLLDEETVVGRTVGLSFSILDNADIGIVNTQFDDAEGGPMHTYNFVRFNYFLNEQVALSLATGGWSDGVDTTAAGSVGGNFIILRNIPDSGFSSTFKINAQYLLNEEDGFGDGTFAVSLLGTIGL